MRETVLVVDDDPAFRALAKRLLAAGGLTGVGGGERGGGALSAATDGRPSAALVDIGLPDGDGIDLARWLTDLAWQPRVVLTSVDADGVTDADVAASGARAFVHKADLPNAPLAWLLTGR